LGTALQTSKRLPGEQQPAAIGKDVGIAITDGDAFFGKPSCSRTAQRLLEMAVPWMRLRSRSCAAAGCGHGSHLQLWVKAINPPVKSSHASYLLTRRGIILDISQQTTRLICHSEEAETAEIGPKAGNILDIFEPLPAQQKCVPALISDEQDVLFDASQATQCHGTGVAQAG
jgi:hypothetical protein